MRIKHNQQGFSHWLILLLILLLLVIGFVGWRVWDARSNEDTSSTSAPVEKDATPADEVVTVRPPSEGYQVTLPDTWVSSTCADTPDLLFLAPTEDKLGTCNSESGGTVAIARNDGNIGYGADYYAADPYYGDAVYTPITIDGIAGYKVSYSVATETELGFPPVGTQVVQYVLFDGTHTYTTTYTRMSGDPDLTTEVQTLAESFDKL